MALYRPALHGMPSYFISMLDDRDRCAKYDDAIARCIHAFASEQGRAPRVLDLGCGSGLLSALALRHGAEHVTALDANRDMADLCRATLEAEGFDESRYSVVCGAFKGGRRGATGEGSTTRSHFVPRTPFDVLVSEILGTMAFSEGVREYTELALPHLNRFECGHYVVPRAICLTAAVYDVGCSGADAANVDATVADAVDVGATAADSGWKGDISEKRRRSGASLSHRLWAQALDACLPMPRAGEVDLTHSRDVGVSMHLTGARRVSPRVIVRSDIYESRNDSCSACDDARRWPAQLLPCSAFTALDCHSRSAPDHHLRLPLVVFEWTAELFSGVTVSNTVEELERMDARSAAARAEHWGFMICRAPAGPALALKVVAWERGMPRVALQQRKRPRERCGNDNTKIND